MAIDLVSLIKQFLTPDMVQKLAAALGLDATQTQTAIGGAIPALLAGITGAAAQPGGAQKLADAANQQASGFDGLADMLGGSSWSRTAPSWWARSSAATRRRRCRQPSRPSRALVKAP